MLLITVSGRPVNNGDGSNIVNDSMVIDYTGVDKKICS